MKYQINYIYIEYNYTQYIVYVAQAVGTTTRQKNIIVLYKYILYACGCLVLLTAFVYNLSISLLLLNSSNLKSWMMALTVRSF